jgi:hypothetical protein
MDKHDGVRIQVMQEVGMVLSRNRKLSPGRDSSEDPETRIEWKQV